MLNLELAMFEDTGDANLEALAEVVKQIAQTKQVLISLNALQVELEE